jgi:acyl-coenzyme A synthetase/AMP-(fatty) acid ligase
MSETERINKWVLRAGVGLITVLCSGALYFNFDNWRKSDNTQTQVIIIDKKVDCHITHDTIYRMTLQLYLQNLDKEKVDRCELKPEVFKCEKKLLKIK